MKWIAKALLQKAFSMMPGGHRINYIFQKRVSKRLIATEASIATRIRWAGEHLAYYTQVTGNIRPNSVLELGTGWWLTVPIAFFLCGIKRIATIDITPLLRMNELRALITVYANIPYERLKSYLPQADEIAYQQLVALSQTPMDDLISILKTLHIEYLITDARETHFDEGEFDLIVSNTTLEHISKPILTQIFGEFARISGENTIMSHLIDLSDHYAHVDKSLTPYNFLRYSQRTWAWFFNNNLHYQSRLRFPNYQRIHTQTGFEIIIADVNRESAPQLAHLKIHPDFAKYSQDDLAVTSAWMISRLTER